HLSRVFRVSPRNVPACRETPCRPPRDDRHRPPRHRSACPCRGQNGGRRQDGYGCRDRARYWAPTDRTKRKIHLLPAPIPHRRKSSRDDLPPPKSSFLSLSPGTKPAWDPDAATTECRLRDSRTERKPFRPCGSDC